MKWIDLLKSSKHSLHAGGTAKTIEQPVNPISENLSENLQKMEKMFADCQDVVIYQWRYGPELEHTAFSIYFNTLTQTKHVNFMKASLQDLVTHEVGPATMINVEQIIDFFESSGVSTEKAQLVDQLDTAVDHILDGHVVIFFNHWKKALSYFAGGVETRQVSESINEPVVIGPHESAVENLQKNIGLIRLRVKSSDFKLESFKAGDKTKTQISFGYLNGAVNPETLAEFKKRIATVKHEEILETSYIEELIEDSTYSVFPQFRYTERPDVAAASLLDGKIIVLVSGTPSIMICPGLFLEFFQTSEDYYQRAAYSSLIRLLRIFAFVVALSLPSMYIALSTFHSELIPTVLLLAILDTREGIPFPAFVEALLMEFFFELMREAGIRLPRPVGSAVSIVGALVIGQAAIQAKIASPAMVIVVSLTGIASFSLPQYSMAVSLRILRFPLMVLAASLGGFGLMIGFLLVLLHLSGLRSMGQPYLSPAAPLSYRLLLDVVIRAPLKLLLRSPRNRHMHKVPRN
ncbi:spore germination protein [Paenibacillus cremeus]|uniref:Spore germination protein n=1 Tax=Paenibacillus cremeus TaxID=2163881 RepID=A0A559KG71_9BACL|nr:spore germination protein [Paenibacillus cremeus]TVY11130.1 spore germination protein [Paenibacillus cremeus]